MYDFTLALNVGDEDCLKVIFDHVTFKDAHAETTQFEGRCFCFYHIFLTNYLLISDNDDGFYFTYNCKYYFYAVELNQQIFEVILC